MKSELSVWKRAERKFNDERKRRIFILKRGENRFRGYQKRNLNGEIYCNGTKKGTLRGGYNDSRSNGRSNGNR